MPEGWACNLAGMVRRRRTRSPTSPTWRRAHAWRSSRASACPSSRRRSCSPHSASPSSRCRPARSARPTHRCPMVLRGTHANAPRYLAAALQRAAPARGPSARRTHPAAPRSPNANMGTDAARQGRALRGLVGTAQCSGGVWRSTVSTAGLGLSCGRYRYCARLARGRTCPGGTLL